MTDRVLTITPERLHDLMQAAGVPLIDVRAPGEYRAGHVPGALLLPLGDDFGPARVRARLAGTTTSAAQTLYITCQSGLRARLAAERLIDAGHRNVAVLEGGTEAWERAGLPVRRCGPAVSVQRQAQIAIGVLIVLKVIFGYTVHELFFAAAALVGAGLVAAGVTRWCGMERLVALMPWNRSGKCPEEASLPSG
jgi:rhodanese-related sulfurtransferase